MADEETKKPSNGKNTAQGDIPCSQASLKDAIEQEEQLERLKIDERVENRRNMAKMLLAKEQEASVRATSSGRGRGPSSTPAVTE